MEAAGKIASIIAATSEEAAVLHHWTVIGEAINRLSPEMRDRP
jgi:uncharacterized protein with HEPN domain